MIGSNRRGGRSLVAVWGEGKATKKFGGEGEATKKFEKEEELTKQLSSFNSDPNSSLFSILYPNSF